MHLCQNLMGNVVQEESPPKYCLAQILTLMTYISSYIQGNLQHHKPITTEGMRTRGTE